LGFLDNSKALEIYEKVVDVFSEELKWTKE